MKIWQMNFEVDAYDNLIPVRDLTLEEKQTFDGRMHKNTWKPLKIKRMEPKKKLPLADVSGFFFIPAFNQRAVNALLPLIANSVELLELDFSKKQYFGINVINVLDVIDHVNSKFTMFSDQKRILTFEKYAFRMCNEIKEAHIFKIVDKPLRIIFVSDEFKRVVEETGLTGFKFELVWDSEEFDK